MRADADIPEDFEFHGTLYPERIIDRKSAYLPVICPMYLVYDCGIQSITGSLCVGGPDGTGIDQTAEIDHVGIALAAVVATEVVCRNNRTDNRNEVCFVVCRLIKMLGIELEGRAKRGNFAQVRQRKCRRIRGFVVDTHLIEAVTDRFAERDRIRRRICSEAASDRRIIPSGTGLKLLRTDHVFRIGGEHGSGLNGAHQAGIKADEVKSARQSVLNAVECAVDIPQGETVQVGQFIKADTVDAAAAVIP